MKLTTYAVFWIRAFIMHHLMATSRMVSCASTREGRRRFFDARCPVRTVARRPGPARHDAPIARSVMSADDGAPSRRDLRGAGIPGPGPAGRRRVSSDARRTPAHLLDLRLLREKPARLEEVGKRFAVSGERVRQLEAGVRRNLRNFIAAAIGEPERAVA